MQALKIGTCSWNYDSWVGLVYSAKQAYSAAYLREYAQAYPTVEIDSWFYKLPDSSEVEDYLAQAGDSLTFACKATESIVLTHERTRGKTDAGLTANPHFLSPELFAYYVDAVKPMLPRIDAIQLEFEYLNKAKMPSLDAFLKKLDAFFTSVSALFPQGLPLAVETRNGNYLRQEYFSLLKTHGVAHVFSEKIYMPPIVEVYEQFKPYLGPHAVIRLLGGDRKEIEAVTKGRWDTIVAEKAELLRIAGMVKDMLASGMRIQIYVNNHFEGSAPKTIERLHALLGA